jgi:DNA topoisomerase I
MKLIIVESPAKSKTIENFLKGEYKVISSYGHVRDLPKSKIGIDVEDNFNTKYVNLPKAKKNIDKIKELAKKSDLIFLATDPDREGEAISWHISEVLKLNKKKYKRIVFQEITEAAVKKSISNPRDINMKLVDAQQARRVLDRIVGYKLSPFLWKKIARGLSAGRVQSVTLRFITDREEEINNFEKKEYWTVQLELEAKNKKPSFLAQLIEINEKKIDKLFIQNKKDADSIIEGLENQKFVISNIRKKETKKKAQNPFITSTLQQEAYKKLRFSSKFTMMIAQKLYEKGLITYHRTDSYNLSTESISKAESIVIEKYGKEYWQGKKNIKKSKLSQEAHEAIRPSHPEKTPEKIKDLDEKSFKLYNLIWVRFITSLMSPAIIDQVSVDIKTKNKLTFRSSGQSIKFDGFLKLYSSKFIEKNLPDLKVNEELNLLKIMPEQHFTQPPARYNEATLIKVLEEKGIGRPSTYAPTISTIQQRNYVTKNDEKRFIPTDIGIIVSNLLINHFPDIVDQEFTAKMEKNLDEIADGKVDWKSIIKSFYLPFEKNLKEKEMIINKKDITEKETDQKCDKCGSPMILKIGRFGNFLACSNYPECKNTKSVEEESSEPCEECGGKMVLKRSKFGSFWGCSNYPECKNIRKDEQKIGVKCPTCNTGDVIKKKSKKGRTFYGCNRYPECDFISSKKPSS